MTDNLGWEGSPVAAPLAVPGDEDVAQLASHLTHHRRCVGIPIVHGRQAQSDRGRVRLTPLS
jgi:hypothetical protein